MLERKRRLDRKAFLKFGPARSIHSPHLVLKYKPASAERFAAVVSKKIASKAVLRNKLRRRVYSAVRAIGPLPRPIHGIFYAKAGLAEMSYSEFKTEIVRLLQEVR